MTAAALRSPSFIRGPLPRHERRLLRLPAALLPARDAGDLGIGLALQLRREDAHSDGPSLGWSAGPRLGNRAFSFSTEFAVQAPEALAHHGD